MRTVFVAVDVLRLQSLCRLACLHCGEELAIHQPDPEMPERMLATCAECRSWYLIDCVASVMVLLPNAEDLQQSHTGPN